jgi:hypothetical protein
MDDLEPLPDVLDHGDSSLSEIKYFEIRSSQSAAAWQELYS